MEILSTEWRRPTNTSADEKGGIHDDETAQKLGFAGGTVAGSLHMEQFPPLLVDYFGEEWWRRGGMSLYFKQATMDGEPVKAFFQPMSEQNGKLWMENEAGDVVMSGTASLGEDPGSELRERLTAVRPAGDLRMLADVRVGAVTDKLTARESDAAIDARLKVITEPMDVYADDTSETAKWGGRVLPIAPFVHLFRGVEQEIAPVRGPFVGLFGAIEVQYLNGPVVSNKDYHLQGQAIALSESPEDRNSLVRSDPFRPGPQTPRLREW